MKRKSLFTYFSLVIVITTSMFIYSCQKEQTGVDKTENQTEQSFKDVQLEKQIIAFKDKIGFIRENPNLKSGNEPMEIDSAIWYIEATSNLTYGDASFDSQEFVVDSAFIIVPVTNGQILWVDVQTAYDQVIDSLSEHNANITTSEKQLIVADVSLKESDDNTVILEIISGFGTYGTTGFGNDYPWFWGGGLGRCDDTGLGGGQDAAGKIAYLANMLIPVPSGNAYYTDVSYKYINYWDVPTNNNPYGDYLLFHDYQEVTLIPACLSTDEISYYKNAMITIGNMYKPTGKSVIRYFLWDDYAAGITPNGDDYWDMAHFAMVKYAIWHISINPPDEF
jgi:hypothetical protein